MLSTSSLSLPATVAAAESPDEIVDDDDDDDNTSGCSPPDSTPARRHSFFKLQSLQPLDNRYHIVL